MNPDQIFGIVITAIISFGVVLLYTSRHFFRFREKRLEVDARLAAEKAAQYAASNAQLEQRLRVVEQIVTDSGAQTAAQIEALRGAPRASSLKRVAAGDATA
jgi:ABC-type phosphate transport system auxiliary subunit